MRYLILSIALVLLFIPGCVDNSSLGKKLEEEATRIGEKVSEKAQQQLENSKVGLEPRKVVCTIDVKTTSNNPYEGKIIMYIKGEESRIENLGVFENDDLLETVVITKKVSDYAYRSYMPGYYFLGPSLSLEMDPPCDWVYVEETSPSYPSQNNYGITADNYEGFIGEKNTVKTKNYEYTRYCEYKDFPDEYLELPEGKVCSLEDFLIIMKNLTKKKSKG